MLLVKDRKISIPRDHVRTYLTGVGGDQAAEDTPFIALEINFLFYLKTIIPALDTSNDNKSKCQEKRDKLRINSLAITIPSTYIHTHTHLFTLSHPSKRRHRPLRRHIPHMLRPQHRQLRRIPKNRIIIQRQRPTRKPGPKLPHHIARHTRLPQHRILPRPRRLDPIHTFRNRILLEQNRLIERFSNSVVLGDLGGSPSIVVAPLVEIHVYGAVIESGDGEVFLEIDALVPGVGV